MQPAPASPRLLTLATLVVPTAIVLVLGLVTEILVYRFDGSPMLAAAFSLSQEANLPTWWSSIVLFLCATTLFAIARDLPPGAPYRRHWWVLGGGFAYMSLDEAAEIHEKWHFLVDPFVDTQGVLFFSWVLPAMGVVLIVAVAYLSFLGALPRVHRLRFVVAGILYVGGAVFMELPLGAWTEQAGTDNLGYALIDWVEESLEMLGSGFFLWSLHAYRAERAMAAVASIASPATPAGASAAAPESAAPTSDAEGSA